MKDLYSKEAQERRDRFNNVINSIDAVLMNNIPEVDDSIWENWEGHDPMGNDECDFESDNKGGQYCTTHGQNAPDDADYCDGYEEASEVYQWFAVSQNDAEFLKDHNQYITYSDKLDTYFWAICHFGTSWDYVDSMVADILGEGK